MLEKEMQMKKKLNLLLLVLVFGIFSFSTNALAIQNDTSYKNGQIISESDSLEEAYLTYTNEERASILRNITNNSIEPMADELKKSKTITKFYSSFDKIPEFEHYREYSDGHWYGGFLFLTKTEKVNGGWKATFSGYIYALVE